MTGTFETQAGVTRQLLIMGYALTGDVTELTASICEFGTWEPWSLKSQMWDASHGGR